MNVAASGLRSTSRTAITPLSLPAGEGWDGGNVKAEAVTGEARSTTPGAA